MEHAIGNLCIMVGTLLIIKGAVGMYIRYTYPEKEEPRENSKKEEEKGGQKNEVKK